jgi:cation diffusion facilitator family transporter
MSSDTIVDTEYIPAIKDPLNLKSFLKTDSDINDKSKKVKAFYHQQNELIATLLGQKQEENDEELKVRIAIYGSAMANFFLVILQLSAAITSGSLAILATAADAIMDLASSIVIILSNRAANGGKVLKYPTGKARMETAGVVVFSTLMATVSIQVVIEAVKALATKSGQVEFNALSLSCVGIAIAVKFCLYLYCSALKKYPTPRILAMDHRNDVAFNSFGLILGALGAYVLWWLDPAGAILISLLILRTWTNTALEHISYIVGKSAEPSFLQKLTYVALTHDPRITEIDTCRAYHSGNNFVVEIDIVLPPDTSLKLAHDIGEDLQFKLEKMNEVERAFVHIDYESKHTPEH